MGPPTLYTSPAESHQHAHGVRACRADSCLLVKHCVPVRFTFFLDAHRMYLQFLELNTFPGVTCVPSLGP